MTQLTLQRNEVTRIVVEREKEEMTPRARTGLAARLFREDGSIREDFVADLGEMVDAPSRAEWIERTTRLLRDLQHQESDLMVVRQLRLELRDELASEYAAREQHPLLPGTVDPSVSPRVSGVKPSIGNAANTRSQRGPRRR